MILSLTVESHHCINLHVSNSGIKINYRYKAGTSCTTALSASQLQYKNSSLIVCHTFFKDALEVSNALVIMTSCSVLFLPCISNDVQSAYDVIFIAINDVIKRSWYHGNECQTIDSGVLILELWD